MGLGHSTTIVRNGLVFYYDASNTEKSWRGRPTTNNASNGRVDYYSRWATATTFPALPFSKKTDVYVLTLGNNYLGGSGDFNITNGNTYTISYWYYIDTVQTMYHYMLPLNGSYAPVATTSASTFVNTNNTRNVSGNINGWVWGYQTFTVNAVPTYMRGTYTDAGGFSDNDPTGKMYITNVMIESGSVPSGPYGYTGGTRSVTQAIRDITNNNTINTQSLTYNVDGTFSFNSANSNYLEINPITLTNSSYTVDAWIKRSSTGVGHGILSDLQYGWWTFFVNSSNNIVMSHQRDLPTFSSNSVSGGSIGTGWTYVTGVFNNSSGMSVYVNGVLENSNSSTVLFDLAAGRGPQFIGLAKFGAPNSLENPFNGQIGTLRVYNRALTATEVLQNFAAQRDRYGI